MTSRLPLLLSLAVLLAACRFSPPPEQLEEKPEPTGTLIIMVMDGARVEETLGEVASSATGSLPEAWMPEVWKSLLPRGVRVTNAWNLSPTVTVPAHATVVTGRRMPVANYPATGDIGVYRPTLPTLAETLRQARPDINRRMAITVANTQLLRALGHSIWPGLGYAYSASYLFVHEPGEEGEPLRDDFKVLQFLKLHMQQSPVALAMVNLHQVDRSGHYGEEMEYPMQLKSLDEPLVHFWNWAQGQALYKDHIWMVLMADHGRHSNGTTDPPWRNHGCSCNGCRQVPFLLLGPGVKVGVDSDDPLLLEDIAPTLAALMGIAMPWADGLVRDDLLEQPTGLESRSGLAALVLADQQRAELAYLQDPAHRNQLNIHGQRVSSADALVVEAPSMAAQGDKAWLCFRELQLTPEGEETLWIARCLASDDAGASWTDIGFPYDSVGPYWKASLDVDDQGRLVAAYAYNPQGVADEGNQVSNARVTVELARHDGSTWLKSEANNEPSFPTDAVLLPVDGGWIVAVGGSDGSGGPEERHSRDIYLAQVSASESSFSWGKLNPAQLSALAEDDPFWRLEQPALRMDKQGTLWLAATGFVAEEGLAVVASSTDNGASWDNQGLLEVPGRIMPHLRPGWLDDRAVFAVVEPSTQAASICTGLPDEVPSCFDARCERILSLQVHGKRIHALVDTGTGHWEPRAWDETGNELRGLAGRSGLLEVSDP